MNKQDIVDYFLKTVNNSPDESESIAAILTLNEFIKQSPTGTLAGLLHELNDAIETMVHADVDFMTNSISSACCLYLRYITLSHEELEDPNFQKCRAILLERGNYFVDNKCRNAREKIILVAMPFLGERDSSVILTHSRSRVVYHILKRVSDKSTNLKVFVTRSMPDDAGLQMCEDLKVAGIDAVPILDSAIGYVMERVKIVLMGAEVVCQSGGVLNKVGSYTIAICAKTLSKPVYIAAETFKFSKTFPLNNRDIKPIYKYRSYRNNPDADLTLENPMVDYIPPEYISHVFTNIGALTPVAVTDELIKLYSV